MIFRHGRNHTINPTNVNYRANIWAMKDEGCTHVIVTTASGSLREDYKPGEIVFLDQFIDRFVYLSFSPEKCRECSVANDKFSPSV